MLYHMFDAYEEDILVTNIYCKIIVTFFIRFSDLHWHGARSALIALVYEVLYNLFL